ncbi:sialidase family protein [Lysinibacillus fusiformis]|uniref:sialidase family protein n=1 Tax=Lysinibacillus fusiformis TaxID=28031 RepID=UPI0011A6386F|nr:sialidase family protein [Lysinibacillus fusiformis]
MAQYYYDKYTSIANNTPIYGWTLKWDPETTGGSGTMEGYSSYTIDANGNATANGSRVTLNSVDGPYGTMYSTLAGGIQRWTARAGNTSFYIARGLPEYGQTGSNTTYSRGSLVQAGLVAEDGTYPANGRHTDSFWYVKGAAVPTGPLGPGVITDQTYSKSNFGDKITRLSNGWLVAATKKASDEIFLFKSTDGGVLWTPLCSVGQGATGSIGTYAIASDGTKVYVAVARNISNNTVNYTVFDALTVQNMRLTDYTTKQINISINLATVTQIQIYVDPKTKFVHVAWLASASGSSPTQNVYHSVSTNGGINWSSTTMVTKAITTESRYNYTHIGLTTDSKGVATIFATSGTRLDAPSGTSAMYCVYVFKNSTTFGASHLYVDSNWTFTIAYDPKKISFTQTQVTGVKDKDGYFHITWLGYDTLTSSRFDVWYGRSKDDGATWDVVNITNQTIEQHNYPTISADKSNKVVVTFARQNQSNSRFYVYQMVSTSRGNDFGALTLVDGRPDSNTNYPSVLYDSTFAVNFGDIAPIMYEPAGRGVFFKGSVSTNNRPSITIVSPENNQTLYENDKMNISGDAYDSDKDQSVTVFYQINGEQRKVLATNVSQTQITLSKQLTFKDGKLYDGETVLTGTLAEGVAHTLKVWAVDSENGQSATVERTFYVVPNRAPLLAIDAVVPSGIINADKFKVNGTASDQDANSSVKVNYRINGANPIEIYNGTGGAWEFEVSLGQLQNGENLVVVEVIDNYNAKTSKTIKLNKDEVKTPILQSVARYNIEPPKGSAKGVLLFVERDEELDLKVELSMKLTGEQEQFETLTPESTAPMPYTDSVVEDTFYYEATEPKSNIILKLTPSRSDLFMKHKIHLVSGAVE